MKKKSYAAIKNYMQNIYYIVLFMAFKKKKICSSVSCDCQGSHVTGVVAVHSAPFLPTHVTTAVGNLTALPLWVCHFACQSNMNE